MTWATPKLCSSVGGRMACRPEVMILADVLSLMFRWASSWTYLYSLRRLIWELFWSLLCLLSYAQKLPEVGIFTGESYVLP